jgi:hypothetical protein
MGWGEGGGRETTTGTTTEVLDENGGRNVMTGKGLGDNAMARKGIDIL